MTGSGQGSDFRLTVVGCAGSYPGPDSAASCYLVQAEAPGDDGEVRTWSLVLDLGNGALGQLQRYVDPLEVDAVLLSHLHTDHCVDMASYHVLRKWHPAGQPPVLDVWGPAGTDVRLNAAYDLPTLPGQRDEFAIHEYGDPFRLGPFRVHPVPVDHPVPAYGLRISVGDRTMAYSGDTGMTPSLLELASEADLFLCEASFRETDDNPPSLHLSGHEAGELAVKAGVRKLVLTHIPPWHDKQAIFDEAVRVYDGPCELAAPGLVYHL